MKHAIYLLGVIVLFVISGCNKGLSPEEQLEEDISIIKQYLSSNGLVAEETPSGLHYIINQEGTGNFPTASDDVRVRYRGYFTDGDVFDESDAAGITFNLQGVIQGWTEGIPKFREGGEGVLLIPSVLAYGEQGGGSIPPNTVLLFDVELLDIVE